MKNKILIPLVIIGALATFFSFKYGGKDEQSSEERNALIQETVMKTIKEGHYSPRNVDDSFSAHVFNRVLDDMDFQKNFFTKQDIAELDKYKYQIDDEIENGSVEFYEKLNQIYNKRVNEVDSFYTEILAKPFTFNGNEEIQLNGEKLDYAADDNDLKNRYREYLKYRVLAKFVELKKAQEKKKADKGGDTVKMKTDAQLEASARESVRKNQDYVFKRLHKLKPEDQFSLYINSITQSEDPHTEYFPPKEKEDFDVMISGTFFGIGAQLKPENGKITIAAIITGSPSWKEGELKAGDEILKVAQGEAEPVDIEGYDLEDAVRLIRGKKGTEVRLTVKKIDGSIKVIPIIRGEVQLEETFAKSAIINSADGPVGYINLPEFYANFQESNGRRCSEDVALEVQKLKAAGVKGIILDLRNNGGGSLGDVVEMAGLFVGPGPVVQVKNSDGSSMTLPSRVKAPLYDGPMAVMVNEGSASASEIMAAAMQDYKRAVIVGTPTYGKGTVQKVVPLDEFIDPLTRMRMSAERAQAGRDGVASSGASSSIGSLKITIQKFYRVNGGSTQLKGVTPDVILPDPYALLNMGEQHDKAALPWDQIAPAQYTPTNSVGDLANIVALSKARVAANPTFSIIQESAVKLKKQEEDNTVSLNEKAYEKELEENNAISKKLEDIQKKTAQLDVGNLKQDMAKINIDSASISKNKDWVKNLKKDIYIAETVNIINDINKSSSKITHSYGDKR